MRGSSNGGLIALFSLVLTLYCALVECKHLKQQKYEPNWNSLDKRPLPEWYDKAKFGIFLHWGVFSVPSFDSEWFWENWKGPNPRQRIVDFMKANYPPGFTYADFGNQFRAEFFDPDQWTEIFKASGAKYVVLTSKHHEGYSMWPSAYSFNWNAMDIGPHRDLVGDLANSIRKNSSIRFGLYHSRYEWFNPLYLSDKASGFKKQDFVMQKSLPELYDLVHRYKPEVVWSDGDWEAPDTYWNSTEFLAWLFSDSEVKDTVVTNDRWGQGVMCKHGSYFTCSDNYNPGKLLEHKWENCMPVDTNSWGYRRQLKLSECHSIEYIVASLAETVSCGGNLLMNVGPTKEGHIPTIFEERLRQMGEWLAVNGEAIYETVPWKFQNDTTNPDVWYTARSADAHAPVYAILLKYPINSRVVLSAPEPTEATQITLLGEKNHTSLPFTTTSKSVVINLAQVNPINLKWAWVFKMTNLN